MQRYIEKFIRYLEIEKNYSKYTVSNYQLDLEGFRDFLGELEPEKIDYLILRKYLAVMKEKNLNARTVSRHLSTLRSFFKFLVREGYLKNNPITGLSSPKQEKHLPLFLTEEQINSSTDIFPIEFLDMQENYTVIYGKDVLRDISVDIKNLQKFTKIQKKIRIKISLEFFPKIFTLWSEHGRIAGFVAVAFIRMHLNKCNTIM